MEHKKLWIVRKGNMYLHVRGHATGVIREFSYSVLDASPMSKREAVKVASRLQKAYYPERVYAEYRMDDADHNLPRIRDYLCYLGCADDGHGGDITRNGLPILSYEEWMEA